MGITISITPVTSALQCSLPSPSPSYLSHLSHLPISHPPVLHSHAFHHPFGSSLSLTIYDSAYTIHTLHLPPSIPLYSISVPSFSPIICSLTSTSLSHTFHSTPFNLLPFVPSGPYRIFNHCPLNSFYPSPPLPYSALPSPPSLPCSALPLNTPCTCISSIHLTLCIRNVLLPVYPSTQVIFSHFSPSPRPYST